MISSVMFSSLQDAVNRFLSLGTESGGAPKEHVFSSTAYSGSSFQQYTWSGVPAYFGENYLQAKVLEKPQDSEESDITWLQIEQYRRTLVYMFKTLEMYHRSPDIFVTKQVVSTYKELSEKWEAIKEQGSPDLQNAYDVATLNYQMIINDRPTKDGLLAIRNKAQELEKKINDPYDDMYAEVRYCLNVIIAEANHRLDVYHNAGPEAEKTLKVYINHKKNFQTLAALIAKCSSDDMDVSMVKKGNTLEVHFVIKNRWKRSAYELIEGMDKKISKIVIDDRTFEEKPDTDKTLDRILRRIKDYSVKVTGPNAADDEFNDDFKRGLDSSIFGSDPTEYSYEQVDG